MVATFPVIATPFEWAFFLDLDGTLLDIADRPDHVTVPAQLPALLRRLRDRFHGAVAILTGRTIADADRLLGSLKLAAAGVHGAELRLHPTGKIRKLTSPITPDLAEAAQQLERLSPHVMVEQKGTALAVHFRRAATAGPAVKAALLELARRQGRRLRVRSGRMVWELLPARPSKDRALKRLLAAPQFQRRRPVMIGDDRTDEAALALAVRLGGAGLKVRGEHFRGDECHFDNPAQVRSWLEQIVERSMG